MELPGRPGRRLFRTATLLLAAAGPLAAPAAAQSGRADLVRDLDSIARAPVEAGQVAGLTVAVVQGADTLLLEPYGMADLELHVPTPADAVYEIGSVTKQFTAVLALQLAAEGRLDLDADVRDYLPDFDTGGRRIPVRRLLDHTSGIRGYTEMAVFGDLATRHLPRDTLVTLVEREPFDFEPGEALIYNNSAYFLLGLVLEEAGSAPYEELVEERVFEPLGMDRSMYCSNTEIVEGRAHGYQASPGGGLQRAPYLDHLWPYAAGSLCSSAGDLVRWLRMLHHGEVLDPAGYALLTTPEPLTDGHLPRYAKGLAVTEGSHGRMVSHGGGIFGFLTETRWYADHDLYVVVLINTAGPPGPNAVADALAERVLGEAGEPAAVAYGRDLSPFEGSYEGRARGRELTVTVARDGDRLTAAVGDGAPAPLRWIDGTTFGRGSARYHFVMEGGRAGALHLDQVAGHYVLERAGR